jgi:hypothetical protein
VGAGEMLAVLAFGFGDRGDETCNLREYFRAFVNGLIRPKSGQKRLT